MKQESNNNSQLNIEIKTQRQLIQELIEKRGYIKVKIVCDFNDHNGNPIKAKPLLLPLEYTLLQLQHDVRKNYKLKPEEGLFLFINNNKIVEGRTPMKQLAKKYLSEDAKGGPPFLSINIKTIQKYG